MAGALRCLMTTSSGSSNGKVTVQPPASMEAACPARLCSGCILAASQRSAPGSLPVGLKAKALGLASNTL